MTRELMGFYDIVNFNSSIGRSGFGVYGFSIALAGPVAKALIKVKRDPKQPLNKIVLDRLKSSFGSRTLSSGEKAYGSGFESVSYFEDTWLLTGIKVADNCACFVVSNDQIKMLDSNSHLNISYNPNNIDTLQQATAILSTWLLWFNYVISETSFKLPFAL